MFKFVFENWYNFQMKLFFILITLFIIGISAILLFNISGKSRGLVGQEDPINLSGPSPSPLAFEELTIPYLRNRKYNSTLGELSEYSQNSNYTSFLTSYNSDGFKVNGFLTKPTGEQPANGWPGIVFVHGYIPPSVYRTTANYTDYIDFLARNGFVVFKIDLRGNGESEGEPEGAYYSSNYIIDLLNAYSALQNSGFVASDKIGLWGHSMAGNVVLRAVAAKPEIPAASIWAGAVYTYKDFAKYGISDNSYRPPTDQTRRQQKRKLLMDTYGDPKEGNPFWNLVAATNFLGDLKGAIQINHAVNDDVVNIGYSRDLNQILNQTQIPHELNEYPSGGHNITNPSFTPAMQRTVEFFKKYLE